MRENRLSGSMRGGVRRSLAWHLSIRRLRLLYTKLNAVHLKGYFIWNCNGKAGIALVRNEWTFAAPGFATRAC